MTIIIGIVIGVVVIGGAIVLIVAGLRANRSQVDDDPLMTRLEEATQRGDVISSLEQIEMQQPFNQARHRADPATHWRDVDLLYSSESSARYDDQA